MEDTVEAIEEVTVGDTLEVIEETAEAEIITDRIDEDLDAALEELEGSLEVELEEAEEAFDEVELEAILAEEPPSEEVSTEEIPTEELSTEEVPTEEIPTEEVPTEEIPAEEVPTEEMTEETAETIEETSEEVSEEIPVDETAEGIEEETPEAAQKAIAPETTAVETETPKKGFKKRFRAFDLAKMIGLTMGDEAEEKTAAAEEIPEETKEEITQEQFVVIGTDETWGYYASDIETSRIDGYEIFDRMHWIGKDNLDKEAVVLDLDIPLVETYTQPMKVQEALPAQSISPMENGEGYVMDFGQVFTGFVTFQSTLAEGARVTLSYSEDGESFAEDSNAFVYVSDGIPETASPHFTLFTGRYVRLTGWEEQPDPAAFTGFVIGQDEADEAEPATEEVQSEAEAEIPFATALASETEEAEAEEGIEEIADAEEEEEEEETAKAAFDTSDPYLNQMVAEQIGTMQDYLAVVQKLADETLLTDDMVDRIPTDEFCAGIRTACLTADAKEALLQYFRELRQAQVANEKAIPAYLPDDGNASKCCMHAGEAIKGIWALYEMYGDPAILEENEDLIKDAIGYISKEDTEERYLVPCKGIRGEETEGSFITTAYYYEAVVTAMKVADVLGREEEKARYEALAGKIKEAFLDEYFTRSGRLAEDTQTAYVLALRAGLYDEKEKLEEEFRKRLKKDCYQITCGPVGLRDLCMVLAECGDTELAYRFLMDAPIPYDLKQEKAAEFLFTYVNGVCPLTPGFEKIQLRPLPDSRLVYSSCEQQSPKGMIRSHWEVTADEMIQLHFEIPEGCEAQALLPDCAEESLKEQSLTSGTYDFAYQPTKDYLHLFHENSLAGDILKYDESLAILEEADPELAEELLNGDPELLARSLDELISDPEILAQVKEKLFQLQ